MLNSGFLLMFKIQKPVMPYKDFQILTKLGEGAYSTVFKALRRSDNQIYALKKVKIDALNDKEKENALNEVRILASISDPFIISYKEAFFDEGSNNLCIIMEYAEQGDLQKRIKESQTMKKYIPEREIWKCLVHLSKALQVLHEQEILHRDLKSANVFITKENFFKLGDLNVSKIATKGLVYTQTGTPYYASPEVWRDEPYDLKSDIWSLGCVLYEMAALKPPFQANDMSLLFKKVQNGYFEKIPQCYSRELHNIISSCLKVNSNERPMASQILKQKDVLLHMEEMEGVHLVRKSSFKVKLLNKIEIPENLAILKERLPKPNYQNSWEAETELEKKTDKNLKMRVASAESHRTNHIKKNEGLTLGTPSILLGLPKIKAENINNTETPKVKVIAKNLNHIAMNLQNPLMKSPDKINKIQYLANAANLKNESIAQEIKLPHIFSNNNLSNLRISQNEIRPDTPNSNKEKNSNLNAFLNSRIHLKSPITSQINKLNPFIAQNNMNKITTANKINAGLVKNNETPKSIYQMQLDRQKISIIRPNSQEPSNNFSNLIKQSPSAPNYKIILKRPLSHNSGRVDEKKEESEPQISEEKDIGKITNKLRPFSCNSNINKLEGTKENTMKKSKEMNIPQILIKEKSPIKINEPNYLLNIYSQRNNQINSHHLISNQCNKSPNGEISNINNNPVNGITANNRGLLHNQKPFSAPNVARDTLNHKYNMNYILYSKQAMDIAGKNNGNLGGRGEQKSIFSQNIKENPGKIHEYNEMRLYPYIQK